MPLVRWYIGPEDHVVEAVKVGGHGVKGFVVEPHPSRRVAFVHVKRPAAVTTAAWTCPGNHSNKLSHHRLFDIQTPTCNDMSYNITTQLPLYKI